MPTKVTGLLVSTNTICFIVSCAQGDEATRKTICEQLALKILNKIEQGGHIIMSTENPPPVTVPKPLLPATP